MKVFHRICPKDIIIIIMTLSAVRVVACCMVYPSSMLLSPCFILGTDADIETF